MASPGPRNISRKKGRSGTLRLSRSASRTMKGGAGAIIAKTKDGQQIRAGSKYSCKGMTDRNPVQFTVTRVDSASKVSGTYMKGTTAKSTTYKPSQCSSAIPSTTSPGSTTPAVAMTKDGQQIRAGSKYSCKGMTDRNPVDFTVTKVDSASKVSGTYMKGTATKTTTYKPSQCSSIAGTGTSTGTSTLSQSGESDGMTQISLHMNPAGLQNQAVIAGLQKVAGAEILSIHDANGQEVQFTRVAYAGTAGTTRGTTAGTTAGTTGQTGGCGR